MFRITFNALNYLRFKTPEFQKMFSEIKTYHGMEIQCIERVQFKEDGKTKPLEGFYDLQLANGKLIYSAAADDITIADLLDQKTF